MKILQKIVLAVTMATSMLAFSTTVMAAEKKEVLSVQGMIESTIAHIEAAMAATEKADILGHIQEARQAQKDIVVGALDQNRQKASAKLIAATRNTKEGKTKEAKASLDEALAAFKELLELSQKK